MKDDHLQGILFTSSPCVRFASPSASLRLMRRAKTMAGHFTLRSRSLRLAPLNAEAAPEPRDTELGDFIDQADLSDLLSRLRR